MKFSLALLFTFSVLVVGAQITLVPYDEPGKSGTKSILFEYVDEETCDKVKKEFDIEANDPFVNKMRSLSGASYKNQGNRKTVSISPREIDFFENDKFLSNPKIKEIKMHMLFDQTYAEIQGDFTTVTYSLSAINELGYSRNQCAQVLVLDDRGNMTGKIDLPTGRRSVALTEDGKYLAATYGGEVDSDGFHIFETGYVIYDVQSGKEVFRKNIGDQKTLKSPRSLENFFIITYSGHVDGLGKVKTYEIVNVGSRTMHIQTYKHSKLQQLKDISHTGFEFSINGKAVFESYVDYFETTVF